MRGWAEAGDFPGSVSAWERAGGTLSAGPTTEGWRIDIEVPG